MNIVMFGMRQMTLKNLWLWIMVTVLLITNAIQWEVLKKHDEQIDQLNVKEKP